MQNLEIPFQASLERLHARSLHDCLLWLGFDNHDAAEHPSLAFLRRRLHTGLLDVDQTGYSDLASVLHLLRGHRGQAVQYFLDLFYLELRLSGDLSSKTGLGQGHCSEQAVRPADVPGAIMVPAL